MEGNKLILKRILRVIFSEIFINLFFIFSFIPLYANSITTFTVGGISVGDKLNLYKENISSPVDKEFKYNSVTLKRSNQNYKVSFKNDDSKTIESIELVEFNLGNSCKQILDDKKNKISIILNEVMMIDVGSFKVYDPIDKKKFKTYEKFFYKFSDGFAYLRCHKNDKGNFEVKTSIQTKGFAKWLMPFNRETWYEFQIKKVYELENKDLIFIEQHARGDAIWKKEYLDNEMKKLVPVVYDFKGLAKKCEQIDKQNIYFAQIRDYWFFGGYDENPTIRIFDLNDTSPYRDSDLGITPDMESTKSFCQFYNPIYSIYD